MELYHLRTFVTVAEEGHLTRAAERLYTSQPAISAHIKALEEELGLTLFTRTPRGMQLTGEGKRLLPKARAALDASGDFLQQAKSLQNELLGTVRVGLNADAEYLRIAQMHQLVSSRYPQLEVHLLSGASQTNVPDIRAAKLDAGFVFGDLDATNLTCLELAQTPLRIAAPAGWEERVAGATMKDIVHMPWIYTAPDCPFFTAAKTVLDEHSCCRPPQTIVSDNEEALRSLVKAGVGLAIMRADEIQKAEQEGYAFALPVELPTVPLRLAYLKKRENDPQLTALLEVVAEVWGLPATDREAKAAS